MRSCWLSPTLRDVSLKSRLSGFLASFTVPAYTIFSTLLFATMAPATTRSCFEDNCGCALWGLSELGEEGGIAINKEIEAYAGVQCTKFVGMPWSTGIGAARFLGLMVPGGGLFQRNLEFSAKNGSFGRKIKSAPGLQLPRALYLIHTGG